MSKNFEFIFDENGKVADILVSGKPVKRGSMRGFKKAQETPIFKRYSAPIVGRNPFSGVEVQLNALEGTIYAWCIKWYREYECGNMLAPVQAFDDMKYFLLELNPDAYYDLLD